MEPTTHEDPRQNSNPSRGDSAPGTDELSELILRIARDALARGLLEVDPVIPIDYRRVICLTDGSRVDVQMTRLLPCACGRVHGRGSQEECRREAS